MCAVSKHRRSRPRATPLAAHSRADELRREGSGGAADPNEFFAVDLRAGRVNGVDEFPEAKKPAWKLTVDFGPDVGVLQTSAQVKNYSRDELLGRLVVGAALP